MVVRHCCLCGGAAFSFEEHHGRPMRRCPCGTLHQEVPMTLEEYAAWYARAYLDGVYYHTPEHDHDIARVRLAAYRLPLGARLLDVGAANGAFVAEARALGLDAWGQDLAEQADGPHVYVGPLPTIGFPTGHFDVVTLHDVLEHVPDPPALLREVRRILKPEGRLIVDFPRFHHESGAHHWKPIEHLWMLTEAQLADLLSLNGFKVERCDHPVESKVVLYAQSVAERPSLRLLVPPGIGDGYWVMVKLRGWLRAQGVELPEVYVHDCGPRRSGELWQRTPFVRFAGFAGPAPKDQRTVEAYKTGAPAVQNGIEGVDALLSFNGTLQAGQTLDEALPVGGPANWYEPLFRSKAELAAREAYRARFGPYVCVAFWDVGMYKFWLREFPERQIVRMLQAVATAGYRVVVMGAGWDQTGIGPRLARADPRFTGLVGETSFEQLTALLDGARGVLGFPAGNTLLGPYFRKPTLLLWNHFFDQRFWANCVPPDAPYRALETRGANPRVVAERFLGMVKAGV